MTTTPIPEPTETDSVTNLVAASGNGSGGTTDDLAFALDVLVTRLRSQGFRVGVGHLLRLARLCERLDRLGPRSVADLRGLLSPIFATSPRQQEQFYATFDACFGIVADEALAQGAAVADEQIKTTLAAAGVARRRLGRILATVALLILAGVLVYFAVTTFFITVQNPTPTKPAGTSGTGTNAGGTTAAGTTGAGGTTGPLPPVSGTGTGGETVVSGAGGSGGGGGNGTTGDGSEKYSTVSGGQPNPANPPPLPAPVRSTIPDGTYPNRLPIAPPYEVAATIRNIVAALPIVAALIMLLISSLWRGRLAKVPKKRRPPTAFLLLDREARVKERYRARMRGLPGALFAKRALFDAARLMRRRQTDDARRAPDVAASVHATVRGGGFPQILYRTGMRPPEYLVLIEQTSPQDHQAQYFDALVNTLTGEGLHIERYFYDGDPRLCRREFGDEAIYLSELAQQRGDGYRLLIFGDGAGFVDERDGRPASWTSLFDVWTQRVLLTPTPDDAAARTLRRLFRIAPATTKGLLGLAEHFAARAEAGDGTQGDEETQSENALYLMAAKDNHLPRRTPDEKHANRRNADSDNANSEDWQPTTEFLRKWLGEPRFRWLVACAVFPRLQWNLTLYLGAMLDQRGNSDADAPNRRAAAANDAKILLHERTLLPLVTLPWFRAGRLPTALRRDLLQELGVGEERAIRAELLYFLQITDTKTLEETLAHDVHGLEVALQKRVLRDGPNTFRRVVEAVLRLPRSQTTQDAALRHVLRRNAPMGLPPRVQDVLFKGGTWAFGPTGLAWGLAAMAGLGLGLGMYLLGDLAMARFYRARMMIVAPTPTPRKLEFEPKLDIGYESKEVTIDNVGNAPLTLDITQLTGNDRAQFQIPDPKLLREPLLPNQRMTFKVRFLPKRLNGALAGALLVLRGAARAESVGLFGRSPDPPSPSVGLFGRSPDPPSPEEVKPPANVVYVMFDPNGGEFIVGKTVEVNIFAIEDQETRALPIRYTTNNTNPTATKGTRYTRYKGTLRLTKTTTVRAVAVLPDGSTTPVASATYKFVAKPAVQTTPTPTITPNGGERQEDIQVTLTSTLRGARILYTTDGSAPTETNHRTYRASRPILLRASEEYGKTYIVRAIALSKGRQPSAEARATFNIQAAGIRIGITPAPTFTPNGGTHEQNVTVRLACDIPNAEIRYIIQPDSTSAKQTVQPEFSDEPARILNNGTIYRADRPIVLSTRSATEIYTIRAIAFAPNKGFSETATATFTVTSGRIANRPVPIDPPAANPLPTTNDPNPTTPAMRAINAKSTSTATTSTKPR